MVYIEIHCRSDCLILICSDDIPSDKAVYLKLNGIGVINDIIKLFIYIAERGIKGLG
jgi:hypothetical protein